MASISLKNNKVLIWILVVMLAGVWGEVGYQLIMGGNSTGEDMTRSSTSISNQTSKTGATYSFIADVRDPFTYREPAEAVAKKVVKSALQIWVPPPLRLEGVIIKAGKRTAIVESSDGKTFFISPGDTLYGVNILAVDNEKVAYHYGKKDTGWVVGK